jgi:hypothetical protein
MPETGNNTIKILVNSSSNTNNKISIRLQPDGFSLYITDSESHLVSSKTVQANIFELTTPALMELIKSQPEITANNHLPSITIENTFYNLLPENVFSIENKKEIINFQHNLTGAHYSYEQNKIESTSAELVFAIPESTKSAIHAILGNVTLIHNCTKLANSALLTHENGIIVAQLSGYIHILILKDAKILLLNSYSAQTDNDILYHIINTSNVLQLSGLCKSVYLYSEVPNPGLMDLLKLHIEKVYFVNYQNL